MAKVFGLLALPRLEPHIPGRVTHAAKKFVLVPGRRVLISVVLERAIDQGEAVGEQRDLPHGEAFSMAAAVVRARGALTSSPSEPVEAAALAQAVVADTSVAALR